jgi:hypothetical protein
MSHCIDHDKEKRMKRVKTVMYLLGVGYLGLHIGMGSPALADNGHGNGHGCNNRTLKGTYIFTQDGTESRAPSTTQPNGDRRPFGYAGIEKYDGRGNFDGINTLATARRTDQVPTVEVSEFVEYSGTYTVNPNCTVTWTSTDQDGFTSNYHLFLSPDGEKFTFISVSAEVIIEDVPTLVQDIVGVGTAYRSDR